MKALVTGGGGFVGSHVARALRARGDSVRVLARGDYPELRALGVETVRGDVTDARSTADACAGVDVVFHAAAKAGGWGPVAEFEAINVDGTRNVLAGCRSASVRALVFTSTASVVHDGGDLEGADESLPYPSHYPAPYPRTKAAAERLALAASTPELPVISLRPHLIWGPGDRHLLPRLVERAKKGRLRPIGTRDPKHDTLYIDNCTHAHLLAADRLLAGAPLGGRAYFMGDDAPQGVWTMANRMLACAGVAPVAGPVPPWAAWMAGAGLEAWHWLTRNAEEPALTRFAASELSHAQWFDHAAARRDLGYAPLVTVEEGLRRLAASHVSPTR